MIAYLNSKFDQIGFNKFLLYAATSLFLSDLLNVIYVIQSFLPKILAKWIPFVIQLKGGNVSMLGPEGVREISALMTANMSNTLFIFLLFHTFIYFLVTRRKKWAIKYANGYSITGAILTILTLPAMVDMGHLAWTAVMGSTTFIYLGIFLGLKHFKKSLESQNL